MVGGPSQFDTFDPKPELKRRHGEQYDFKQRNTTSQRTKGDIKGSPFKFHRCGQSGLVVSELFPNLRRHADELTVIRSMTADSAAHGAASLQMNTGYLQQGFPSMGSWLNYGLGSVNENLPGFVVMVDGVPYAGAQNWSAGFMPTSHQGTVFQNKGTPVRDLKSAAGATREEQRRELDLLGEFNEMHRAHTPQNRDLAARVSAYELAYRMQMHVPEAVDIDGESAATKAMYGIGEKETESFGRNCLLARRLVERGVRFVQLYHSNWDTHGKNDPRHRVLCKETDKPIAGLIEDLKRRGLLDETIVVWSGEFGRTPLGNGKKGDESGRDHHAEAFSAWLAGGGMKGGHVHGATDELGFAVAENPVHVHDLHATILHQMGVDHEKLTYRHSGRDFRLTDVEGDVVESLLK
jgi:hypothetical protein